MKISYGAIFYSVDPGGNPGVILGDEGDDCESYLPFKGAAEQDETPEQAACREIKEETSDLVDIGEIQLELKFSTKRKTYWLGLIKVDYDIVEKFNQKRELETRPECLEKKKIKFFTLVSVLQDETVHIISKTAIRYYFERLIHFNMPTGENEHIRSHALSLDQAAKLKSTHIDIMDSSDSEGSPQRKPIMYNADIDPILLEHKSSPEHTSQAGSTSSQPNTGRTNTTTRTESSIYCIPNRKAKNRYSAPSTPNDRRKERSDSDEFKYDEIKPGSMPEYVRHGTNSRAKQENDTSRINVKSDSKTSDVNVRISYTMNVPDVKFLRKPKRFGLTYTANAEKLSEATRVWRQGF